jgi:hypothetical protein
MGSRCPLSIRRPPIMSRTRIQTQRTSCGFCSALQRLKQRHLNGAIFVSPLSHPEKPKADPCFDYASRSVALQQTSIRHLLPNPTTSHEIYSRNISWRSSIVCPDRPFSAKTVNLHPGDAWERDITLFGKVGKGQQFNPVTHRRGRHESLA